VYYGAGNVSEVTKEAKNKRRPPDSPAHSLKGCFTVALLVVLRV
jgi:hypothetical protein